jgi:hypothetical protein
LKVRSESATEKVLAMPNEVVARALTRWGDFSLREIRAFVEASFQIFARSTGSPGLWRDLKRRATSLLIGAVSVAMAESSLLDLFGV